MDAAAGGDFDVVLEQTFTTTDVEQLAQDLVAEGPDTVLISAFEDDTALLIEAIADAADGAIPFVLFGTDANTGGGIVDLVSDAALLDGMVGTFVAAPAADDFLSQMSDLDDPTYAAEADDAVVLAALATISGASDSPGSIETEIVRVASGGTDCASFSDCASLLADGDDIRYAGRSGDLDLTVDLERETASVLSFRYDQSGEFEFESVILQG